MTPAGPRLRPDIDRIVIVCPTWIGDTVMATPLLRAIRAARPAAHLVAAVRPGLDEVLRGAPWLDAIQTIDPRGLAGPWRAAATLRAAGAGAVLLLPNSFRTALMAWMSRVPVRIGYERDGRRRLLTHSIPVPTSDRPTSMLAYFRTLGAEVLGDAPDDALPELFVTDDESAAANKLLEGVADPFVVMVPGANRADKRWPAERFARVADVLAECYGLRTLLSGAPGEREVLAAVRRAATCDPIDLGERGLTLGSLKGVMRRALCVLSNDTGPRHIAVALGTPVVSLFGPTDERWTSLETTREHALRAEPFLPEELIADRHPQRCRIDRIEVEDVLAAMERQLRV